MPVVLYPRPLHRLTLLVTTTRLRLIPPDDPHFFSISFLRRSLFALLLIDHRHSIAICALCSAMSGRSCVSVFSYHMNVLVYPRLFAGSVLKQRSTFSGGHEKYYRVDLNLQPNIAAAVHQTINTKDLIIVSGRPALLNVLLRKKNGHELIMPRK